MLYFQLCSVSSEPSVNLLIGLLQKEHQANGDQCKVTDAVTGKYDLLKGLGQRFPYFLRRGALFRREIRHGALSSPLYQRYVCAYLAVFT